MATYLSTIKFTQQGFKAIRETTKRAAALKVTTKKMGIKVTNIYWTLGAYDGLLVFDAPDDETATGLLLQLAAEGNVQTTTVRAFTAAEMDRILEKMSGRGKSS
ncbi:MAG: GYD domain-containing protein [Deltaproteobacteria bacterium]